MRNNKSWRGLFSAILIGILCAFSAGVSAGECGVEAYSLPDDTSDLYPLAKPSPEFSRMLNAAKKGSALEQRNLAVSYESGFQVRACLEKAEYWYRLAAKGDDEVAKKWVARRDTFDKLFAGPECVDAACKIDSSELPQFMALVGPDGPLPF